MRALLVLPPQMKEKSYNALQKKPQCIEDRDVHSRHHLV